MLSPEDIAADARELEAVEAALLKAGGGRDGLIALVAQLLRRAIDEVVDAPRTGRLLLEQCEKTEKTYLGTKVEVLLRSALKLRRGLVLDLLVAGREVDIKHTIGRSGWMIPREAVDRICLLISESELSAEFKMGLIVCRPEHLRNAYNQDKKLSISSSGLSHVRWIADRERFPPNIWLNVEPELLQKIRAHRGGAKRVAELFRGWQGRRIPRSAIPAIAPQLDPLKRVRENGGARAVLRPDRIAILWGRNDKDVIRRLGLPALYPDEFISIHASTNAELELLREAGHLLERKRKKGGA